MQILGLKFGKNSGDKSDKAAQKPKLNLVQSLKRQAQDALTLLLRYQVSVISLVIAVLLTVTALRMLRYVNPPVDDNKVQQNIAKYKQIRIDPSIVQKIQQLQSSGSAPSPQLEKGRTNPFSE